MKIASSKSTAKCQQMIWNQLISVMFANYQSIEQRHVALYYFLFPFRSLRKIESLYVWNLRVRYVAQTAILTRRRISKNQCLSCCYCSTSTCMCVCVLRHPLIEEATKEEGDSVFQVFRRAQLKADGVPRRLAPRGRPRQTQRTEHQNRYVHCFALPEAVCLCVYVKTELLSCR